MPASPSRAPREPQHLQFTAGAVVGLTADRLARLPANLAGEAYTLAVSEDLAPPGFVDLWTKYPWPEAPPLPQAGTVGRDSSGFGLFRNAIAQVPKSDPVIMEIGAEFGGSTRKFLDFPGTWVISVDPWPDTYGGGSFPDLQQYLGRPGAFYDLFLTFNFDHRNRLVALRAPSPQGPLEVRDAGVHVDFIYIDGDHRYDAVIRDLTIASALFPEAVLAGDDWRLAPRARKYEGMALPVQTAVKRWAAVNDACVETDGNSWLIDPSKPYNLSRPIPTFGRRGGGTPGEVASPEGATHKQLAQIEKTTRRIERKVDSTLSARARRRLRQVQSKLAGSGGPQS